MRCKELEEYIQEYCSERRKIKWEYLDKHYSMLFPAFVENLDILIKNWCGEQNDILFFNVYEPVVIQELMKYLWD